jgi:hypothetical protein
MILQPHVFDYDHPLATPIGIVSVSTTTSYEVLRDPELVLFLAYFLKAFPRIQAVSFPLCPFIPAFHFQGEPSPPSEHPTQ